MILNIYVLIYVYMGDKIILKKPVNVRHAIKRAHEKQLKKANAYVANLAVPLLEPDAHHPEEVELCRNMLENLIEKKSRLVKRPTVFDTLCALGIEPVDARDTVLGEIIPDSIPLRTKSEAWDIVMKNQPLMFKAIKHNRLNRIFGSKNADVDSIARIGMFMAALYWNPEKGAFSTFLYSDLRRCARVIKKERGLVRIPEHLIFDIIKFQRYMKRQGATRKKYAEKTGFPMSKVNRIARYHDLLVCSIKLVGVDTIRDTEQHDYNTENNGEGGRDTIRLKDVDPEVIRLMEITPYDEFLPDDLKEKLEIAIKMLDPKQEEILRLRFGFQDDELTLEEVGEIFSVTRERVRQIEAKALRKMRHPICSGKIKDFQ